MSLVPTYVLAQDGYWYKNPVLGTASWFLCYDDDDPIEIVIQEGRHSLHDILALLKSKGYVLEPLDKGQGRTSLRCYGDKKDDNFVRSVAYFVKHIGGAMPQKLIRRGFFDDDDFQSFAKIPKGDFVYYPALRGRV